MHVSPVSFPCSLHFSVKASGVLRSGSGPRKIHVASPLAHIQHLAKKSTRAAAAQKPWCECSSLAGPSLHNPRWFGPNLCSQRHVHAANGQKWSCAYRFQNQFSHLFLSIYKQQHYPPTPVICTNLFLRKKDHSCFICASLLDVGFIIFVSPPSDSALLFSQAVSPM